MKTVTAASASSASEDQIFGVMVRAAFGQATRQDNTPLAALDETMMNIGIFDD
ncbi:MAG: hypothetical protein ACRD3D_00320 [Terriglobia bacterium]